MWWLANGNSLQTAFNLSLYLKSCVVSLSLYASYSPPLRSGEYNLLISHYKKLRSTAFLYIKRHASIYCACTTKFDTLLLSCGYCSTFFTVFLEAVLLAGAGQVIVELWRPGQGVKITVCPGEWGKPVDGVSESHIVKRK